MNPARMIADLESKAQDLARTSKEVQDGIRAAVATVSSPDGWVTVTIEPNGALRDIAFSLPAEGLSGAQLGWVVMTTVERAQAQVARRVAEVVEPEFGGTAAMEFMTGFLPEEPRVPAPVGVPRQEPEGAELPLPRSLRSPEETGGPLAG